MIPALITGASYCIVVTILSIWLIFERRSWAKIKVENGELNQKIKTWEQNFLINEKAVKELENQCIRLKKENDFLQEKINEASERLKKCNDPQVVVKWLDDLLSGPS